MGGRLSKKRAAEKEERRLRKEAEEWSRKLDFVSTPTKQAQRKPQPTAQRSPKPQTKLKTTQPASQQVPVKTFQSCSDLSYDGYSWQIAIENETNSQMARHNLISSTARRRRSDLTISAAEKQFRTEISGNVSHRLNQNCTKLENTSNVSSKAKVKDLSQSCPNVSGDQLDPARAERYKNNWYIHELNLVPNDEPFDCPVCFSPIEQDAGVQLHECLDCVCRDCLKEHILKHDTPEINCPCSTDGNNCQSLLLDREIKALLSSAAYEQYQARCLQQALVGAIGKVQCPKEGCTWWAYKNPGETTAQFIDCPRCQSIICVLCEAIHEGLSCEEHQARLRGAKDLDEIEKVIQEKIDSGELMMCPGCRKILNKISGCDWVQCSSCKLEICWITKQRRWGPNGRKDTSAGCKCKSEALGGQKCHPNCRNCH